MMSDQLPISLSDMRKIEASLTDLHDKAEVNRVNNEKLLKCVGQLKTALVLSANGQAEAAVDELRVFDNVATSFPVRQPKKLTKAQEAAQARQQAAETILAEGAMEEDAEVCVNPEPDENNVHGGGGVKFVYKIKNGTPEMNKGVYVDYQCTRIVFAEKQLKSALKDALSMAGVEDVDQLKTTYADVGETMKAYVMSLINSELDNLPRPTYLECDVPKPFAGQTLELVINGFPEPMRSAFMQAVETIPLKNNTEDSDPIAVIVARAADDMRVDIDELRCNYPLLKFNDANK